MGRRTKRAIGVLGLLAAAWSGAWFWGKSEIRNQLDANIAILAEQGVSASYQQLDVSGFPFSYRGRLTGLRYQAPIMLAHGVGYSDWQTPWIDFAATLSDFGAINFVLPDQQSLRFQPPGGASQVDVAIRSERFEGRLAQQGGRMQVESGAEGLAFTVSTKSSQRPLNFTENALNITESNGFFTETFDVSAEKFAALGSAPINEAGTLDAQVDLGGVMADDRLWALLDPTLSFPRGPARLALTVAADTIQTAEDSPPEIRNLRIARLAVDAAGLRLDGEGAATVGEDRTPDGALTLRVSGMGGFLDSVVRAQFLPEAQVSLYRVMLDSFGKQGASEGEKVYDIAFKDGYTYINGSPTFIPAPILPR